MLQQKKSEVILWNELLPLIECFLWISILFDLVFCTLMNNVDSGSSKSILSISLPQRMTNHMRASQYQSSDVTNNRSNSLHFILLSVIINKFRANNNNAIIRKNILYSHFCCRFALLPSSLLSIRFPLFFSGVLIFLSLYFLHFSHLICLNLFLII